MRALVIVVLLIFGSVNLAGAQTDTPTPAPTFTPYVLEDFYALGTPTAIPALSLTPRPWATPTRPAPGVAFAIPPFALDTPAPSDNPVQPGFDAISESNSLRLGRYIGEVAVGFYGWLVVNFPTILRALRIMSLIVFLMKAIYAAVQRFAPDLISNTRASLQQRGKSS